MNDLRKLFKLQMVADGKKTSSKEAVVDLRLCLTLAS